VSKIHIKFKNGSKIKTIKSKEQPKRSHNSNYITCPCYDLDNPDNDLIMTCIDIREPITRFVPVWYFEEEYECELARDKQRDRVRRNR